MAVRKIRRPPVQPGAASALTFTVANLGAEAQLVGNRARTAVFTAEHRLEDLRRQAAQSALDWVLAHGDRVEQFRRWSQGTRAGLALEAVLDNLQAVAGRKPERVKGQKSGRKAAVEKIAARKAPVTRARKLVSTAKGKPSRPRR